MNMAKRIHTEFGGSTDSTYGVRRYITISVAQVDSSPKWRPNIKRPTYTTSTVMRPNRRPATTDTDTLPYIGSRLSAVHIKYMMVVPNAKPVRKRTALKHR